MSELAVIHGGRHADVHAQVASLSALVLRAARTLAGAETAAEVLDAKATAAFAYDAAKAAARFAKSKGAFEEVIGSVYRSQADALEIEAMAKRRIADEYEQGRRDNIFAAPTEWRSRQDVPDGNGLAKDKMVIADIGISRKQLHDFRAVRDADEADPGVHGRVARELVESGSEPTRAAVSREINTRLSSFSGDNEWYTPARYIEMAREVMGGIDVDPASNAIAQAVVRAKTHYTAETNGLDKDWHGTVWMNPPYGRGLIDRFIHKLVADYRFGNVTEAVVLTNNSTATAWHDNLFRESTAMCFPRRRVKFKRPDGTGNAPALGQTFTYFGQRPDRFRVIFGAIGSVMVPANDNAMAGEVAA